MPNWCNNTITFTGPKEKIKAIWDEAKDQDKFLQILYPMPTALEETTSPSDSPNWYDWRVHNWGTKWDIDVEPGLEYREEGDTGIIQGWFDSAWAPPIHAYEYFLTHNEDCSIKSYYYEGGCDFAGEWYDFADAMLNPSDFTADEMEQKKSGLIYDLNEHFAFSESVREYEEESSDTEKFIVEKEAVNVG